MTAPFRPIAKLLDQRRSDIAEVEQAAGGLMVFKVDVLVQGGGEVLQSLDFPIRFVEAPFPTITGELVKGFNIDFGNYPTATGMVHDWSYGVVESTGDNYYRGATLILVSTGRAEQNVIFHCRFEGRALTNPSA